jgi:hypothetical protein
MALFNNVQYAPGLKDDTWFGLAEEAAHVCKAPARWLEGELFGANKKYVIKPCDDGSYRKEEVVVSSSDGIRKVCRLGVGILFSSFGDALAVPFILFALNSQEIRLKHRQLSEDEQKQLTELIDKRLTLAKERQGCEPISCLLLSICCLLCCLVCLPRSRS